MDDKTSSGKEAEDDRLAVKNAYSAMVAEQEMILKASGKVIMNKDQQHMFSGDNIIRLKNAISVIVDLKKMMDSKDGATKKFVEKDSAAGDGTTPSI